MFTIQLLARWQHVYFTRMHCGHQAKKTEKRWQESNTQGHKTLIHFFQKTSICFLKQFLTAMDCGKMYIRHLFRYGQLEANVFSNGRIAFCSYLNYLFSQDEMQQNIIPQVAYSTFL